jgi:hypothetical protein
VRSPGWSAEASIVAGGDAEVHALVLGNSFAASRHLAHAHTSRQLIGRLDTGPRSWPRHVWTLSEELTEFRAPV